MFRGRNWNFRLIKPGLFAAIPRVVSRPRVLLRADKKWDFNRHKNDCATYEVANIGGNRKNKKRERERERERKRKGHRFSRGIVTRFITRRDKLGFLRYCLAWRFPRHIFIVFGLTMNEPLVLPPVPDSLLISANITRCFNPRLGGCRATARLVIPRHYDVKPR